MRLIIDAPWQDVAAHRQRLANRIEQVKTVSIPWADPPLSGGVAGRTPQMNTQNAPEHSGLLDNLALQLTLLAIVFVVLIALASRYIW